MAVSLLYIVYMAVIVGGLVDQKVSTKRDGRGKHLDFLKSTLMSSEHNGSMKIAMTVNWWLILSSIFSWSIMSYSSIMSCFVLSIISWTLTMLIQLNFIKVMI